MNSFKSPEILAPAGSPEKLRAAVRFGADAVYLAGREFGMRSASANFTLPELAEAAGLLHSLGKKLYLTVNTLPRGDEYPRLETFLKEVAPLEIDGFIAADLGVIALLKETLPGCRIHISTQAGVCSPRSALAYAALGATRLVLARELSLGEIKKIREALPAEVSLEAFVHGSMCVSWSGRCMLSNMLTGRDANRGECAQPCRWNYTLIEEKRPDERIPVEETPLGTFIMSSKDLCLIEHVGELAAAGVSSFKIEGRVKSAYYAAVVTNAYRIAADALAAHVAAGGAPEEFRPDPSLMRELESVSHREYCTGFVFDSPAENPQLVTRQGYIRDKSFLAEAAGNAGGPHEEGVFRFIQRNRVMAGDRVEILSPGKTGRAFTVSGLFDAEGAPIVSAPHPLMEFLLRVPYDVRDGDILREAAD